MEGNNYHMLHTSNSDKILAVKVTEAFKTYGGTVVVLKGFNMNVQEGTIYGLLGPSGCGKTTLLSSIIGRSRLDAGHIQLSVKKKNQIGYMPQDLSLYDEFSMLETLHYFGSLCGMTYKDILDKGEKLLNLMDMPPGNTQFGLMSGGQQRRFSMSIALLHDPSILILDEPTVGLDPIISASIWVYLKDLASRGKTVIITTHYIEEARVADTIGLMREGVLLAEAPPQDIITFCNTDNLENAFLLLSKNQHTINTNEAKETPNLPATTSLNKSSFFSSERFKAQMLKQWYWSIRNWGIIVFVCLLPLVIILIFNMAIGQIPNPLHFGIINKEESHCTSNSLDVCDGQISLSCKFLHEMENKGLILKYYNDTISAKTDTVYGSTWGFLQLEKNFTEMISLRFDNPSAMSSEEIEESSIITTMDMSNYVASKIVQRKLFQSYKDLSNAFRNCNNTAVTTIDTLPFKMMEPVYGSYDISPSNAATIAVISIVEFYSMFLFTVLSIDMEKKSGILERSLCSGLTVPELLASLFVVQTIILIVQICIVFVMQIVMFSYQFLSTWSSPFLLVFCQGLCGTFLGFATGIIFDDDRSNAFLGIGIVLTQVFLCGVVWPVEAMNPFLKKISYILPLTLSVETFKSLIAKNRGLFHPEVIKGFASIFIWIFISILFSILSIKLKQGIKAKK